MPDSSATFSVLEQLQARQIAHLEAENERLLAALELIASMEQEPSWMIARDALNYEGLET